MAKLVLTDVTNIHTGASTLNANFAAIEAAFEDTVSRSGEAPNELNTNLDANSYRVYNLAPGIDANDAATVGQLTGATPIGTAETFTKVQHSSGTYAFSAGATLIWVHTTGASGATGATLCPALTDSELIIERAANYAVTVTPSAGESIVGGTAGQAIVLLGYGIIRLKCRTPGTWTIISDSASWNFVA